MDLLTKCPRCESGKTVHIESVEVSTCLECHLDWWYSEDDKAVVTSDPEIE